MFYVLRKASLLSFLPKAFLLPSRFSECSVGTIETLMPFQWSRWASKHGDIHFIAVTQRLREITTKFSSFSIPHALMSKPGKRATCFMPLPRRGLVIWTCEKISQGIIKMLRVHVSKNKVRSASTKLEVDRRFLQIKGRSKVRKLLTGYSLKPGWLFVMGSPWGFDFLILLQA